MPARVKLMILCLQPGWHSQGAGVLLLLLLLFFVPVPTPGRGGVNPSRRACVL